MAPSATPSVPDERRPQLAVVLLVVGIMSVGFGVATASFSSPRRNPLELHWASLWGGLVVLALFPPVLGLLFFRYRERLKFFILIFPMIGVRIMVLDSAARSWWHNLGFALIFVVTTPVLYILIMILLKRLATQGEKAAQAKPTSPMWDADTDQPLAAKGPH